jgi:hypothetical protein
LEKKIESLGLRHGIASRMTSLIAISEDPTVDPKDPRRRERLAVELPAEVSAEGVGLATLSRMAPMPMMARMSLGRARSVFERVSECLSPHAPRDEDKSFESDRLESPEDEGSYFMELQRPSPPSAEAVEARVLWSDGSTLILEFEVPRPGFMLPGDGAAVQVRFEDGAVCECHVRASQGSPEGPHEQGLTVRLALSLAGPDDWGHREAWLQWQEAGGVTVDVHVPLTL